MTARVFVAGLSVAAIVGLVVTASGRSAGQTPFDPAALVAKLQATAGDWNKGDLDAFIAPYAAESTFMTAEGPIGREAMRTRYQEKFFGPDNKPRPLRFERIDVRPLGEDHALMTGRFVLGGDGKPDQSGWFTLVWVRTSDGWRILHDHSS